MKVKRRVVIVVLAVVLGLATLIVLCADRPAELYRVTVLPSLGGAFTVPFALNDQGQVVGYSQTVSGDVHLFLWDRARGIEDLGDLNNGKPGGRADINNAGQIAGTLRAADGSGQAFIRDPNGAMHLLGHLGGGWSQAAALNNRGQVAGTSTAADGSRHAFVWDRATGMRDVMTSSSPNDDLRTINDAGLVWGYVDTASRGQRLFIWDPNAGLLASSELPPDTYSLYDLNNHSSFLTMHRFKRTERRYAVLWHRHTGFTKLWCPEGYIPEPAAINDANQVVGWEEIERSPPKLFGKRFFQNHPFKRQLVLWDPNHGRIILSDQIPWRMRKHFTVRDFNNAGVILGVAIKREESSHAVLLEPIPEKWGD